MKAKAIGFCKIGLKHPLETTPICFPEKSLIIVSFLGINFSSEIMPTLVFLEPLNNLSKIRSEPGNLLEVLRAINQESFASMGVIVADYSFPYKQRPASILRESLAPRPPNFTSSKANN